MKPLIVYAILCITFLGAVFSSCEKDLYQEDIAQPKQSISGKVKIVKIEEVPFLVHYIQKYNARYGYLTNQNSSVLYRGIEDLDLDLENIIQFVQVNGLDTYSIAIKKEFTSDESDFYFENLHIIKVGIEYIPFIFKYNPLDDSQKFNITDFTGSLEVFDINGKYEGIIQYEGGFLRHAEPAPPTPPYEDEGTAGTAGSGVDPQPEHSILWYFFHNIFYGNDSGNIYYGSPWDIGESGSSGNGGVIYVLNGVGIQPMGQQGPIPNQNTGGTATVVIVPNEPQWTFPAPQNMMRNRIKQRLGFNINYPSEVELMNWIEDIASDEIIDEIYFFMIDEGDIDQINIFVKEMLKKIKLNPGIYNSIKPFLIEKQINDTNLDPCAKNVLTVIRNTTVCDIAQVLAKLDADASVYNTTIKTEILPNGNTKPATTKWNSPYNYTIFISPDYTGKTKLFRASLILHEMVHAYFMSLFDDYFNANPPNLNAYNDFADLFHYYVTLNHPTSINPADIQHQQMSTDYVDAIARALQEYQTGVAVPNADQPNQIYSDLVWAGLGDTPVFNTMFPDGNPNRQRILNRGAAEQNGTTIGAGTPDAQSPVGLPCN